MPLKPGSSEKTIGENIATERHAGKPEEQAIAIAESEARRSRDGESIPETVTAAESLAHNERFWRQQTPAGVSENVSKTGQGE